MLLKTAASLAGSNKYKRVGLAETKKIIKEINNYGVRNKLRTEAVKTFGANEFYLKDVAKNISKTHGSAIASKFIEAAIKHEKTASAAKAVSEKSENSKKRPVPKYRQALDVSYKKYQYGGAKIGVAGSDNVIGIGMGKPKASVSANKTGDKAGNPNVAVFRSIKPDNFAGGSGSAAISINQKK